MPRFTEDLSGGLYTAPNPAKLQPGQLSFLQNGVYLPGSLALQRARGRSQFGAVTATGTDVDGLRDVQFDNGDHYLLAMISGTATGNGSYRIATVGDTGTFSNLASGIVAGAQLEVVHYRNRFFLFNGVENAVNVTGSNQVVYLSATAAGTAPSTRQHGMLPVNSSPRIVTAAGTFSQTVTGYYEYWTTEMARITADGAALILESAFVGTPSTVFVSSTGVVPTIQIPVARNAITTDWRIYRSPKKDKESDKKFPSGFSISEAATGTSAVPDTTVSTTTSYAFPGNFNGISDSAVVYIGAGANATALAADDAVHATLIGGTSLFPTEQGVYGFNFGGFAGNIRGIEVEVQAYISSGAAPCAISVTIGSARATNGQYAFYNLPSIAQVDAPWNQRPVTKSGSITSTAVGTPTTLLFGSATDRWTPANTKPLIDVDFGSSFMVVLGITKPSTTLSIDYVRVRVTYAATTDSVIQFPTVVYTFGDITSQVAKNGLPPSASTGDLYEDALVVNDVSNRALIRYSAPGEPESFPETYFLDFETRDNDIVTLIRVVNNRLVVGLETAIYRANYLPSERDSSFDRGKAIEAISRSYGCVNPMCGVVFSRDGGSETLAFVSDHGIHGTDGFSFDTYTDGLAWSQIISRTSTSNAICLINDRDRQELLFYYRNDALGNETYMCLHLSYASEHLVDGKPKISGPVHVRNYNATGPVRASLESAWSARRTSGAQDVYLGYGGTATAAGAGFVYRETGTTLPAQDDTVKYATRRMYLGGEGMEWKLAEMYGYCGSYSGAPAVTYTLNNAKTNDAGATTVGSKSLTLGGQALHKVQFQQMCEGLIVTAQVTASAFSQESLILDGEGYGVEDAGR